MMYLQNVDNVYKLAWNSDTTYGDIFFRNEVEQTCYSLDSSSPEFLLTNFHGFEAEAKRLMELNLALPAYEMVLKAGHTFNLLDARGVVSVTERAGYIGRIRELARTVAKSYLNSRAALGFPLLDLTSSVTRNLLDSNEIAQIEAARSASPGQPV